MSGKRKGEYVGVLGALLVHVAIIAACHDGGCGCRTRKL